MSMLDSAIAFAATAHADQVRKYDKLPYIVHPIEVMTLVKLHAAAPTEAMLCAAVLHDVVEDTPVGLDTIQRRFGPDVASLVLNLTDVFVKPTQGNRAKRKELERDRLAGIDPEAQTIKYADLISNTRSIVRHDPGFARTYLEEKAKLLEVMTEGDEVLYRMVHESLQAGQQELVQLTLKGKS